MFDLKSLNCVFSIQKLKETAWRFPFSIACLVGLFSLLLLENHDVLDLHSDVMGRSVVVLGSLYLWFWAARLISQSLTLSFVKYGVLCLAGVGALLALLSSPFYVIHYLIAYPALSLAVMISPYLKGGNDFSFWQFNRKMWQGAALSLFASIIFALGLFLALLAIDNLFDVGVYDNLYGDIWLFALIILGPIYTLSRVPSVFEFSEGEDDIPPGLRFIANWILVPIVLVYLAILYAYFGKILLSGEMPSGYLAYMITGFVGLGVLTYMVAWPLRERADSLPQLKLFYKIFFLSLFIPIGFLFFAIMERVSAYGITEQRYVLMLSAFWFLIIAITKSFKHVPLKIIPASLCVLFALGSFGPWGAVSVSLLSQKARLEGLLNKYDLLKDGQVVSLEAGREVSVEDRVSISSILSYMCQKERSFVIKPWFGEQKCNARDLTKNLGFEYISHRSGHQDYQEKFSLSSADDEGYVLDVRGYDVLVKNVSIYRASEKTKDWKKHVNAFGDYGIDFSFDGDKLNIAVDDYAPIVINVASYADVKRRGSGGVMKDFYILGENADLSYKANFSRISGIVRDGRAVPTNISVNFLYKVKN